MHGTWRNALFSRKRMVYNETCVKRSVSLLRHKKIREIFCWAQMFGIIFLLMACSPSSDAIDILSTASQLSHGGVGTVTGNPRPPQNLIIFSSTDSEPVFDTQSSVELVAPFDYCRILKAKESDGQGKSKLQTQICHGSVSQFNLGVVELNLLECFDKTTAEFISCDHESIDAVMTVIPWYAAASLEPFKLNITPEGTEFTGDLMDILGSHQIGGLQMVVSFVEFVFHDHDSNTIEAAKVIPELQGKTFRICTVPQEFSGTKKVASLCHSSRQTQRGDLIVDLNEDGQFGFLVETPIGFEEQESRPKDYINVITAFGKMTQYQDVGSTGMEQGTDKNSFFKPILPLDRAHAFDGEGGHELSFAFNLADTFTFIDGLRSWKNNQSVCVEMTEETSCPQGNDDPDTVGVYDPAYDTFLPKFPTIIGNFEELSMP